MLNNIIERIRLPFREDRELRSALYDIIGFYPRKMRYYKLALMHKSVGHRAVIENEGKGKKGQAKKLGHKVNNERREFLGDAILDAVVGDVVYKHFPGKPEGFLTNTRSKLVQRETLGKLAHQVGLSKLILSSGRGSSHNSYMDGNAFEALVGAMYLDRGYDACYKFWCDRILGQYLNIDKMAYKEVNFKSKLIEWTQKNRVTLDFRLEEQVKDSGGSPVFEYTVVIEGIDCETGKGFSKKESHQHAAEKTLKMLKSDKKYVDAIFAAKSNRTKMDEDMIQAPPTITEEETTESDEPVAKSPVTEKIEDAASEEDTQQAREDIIAAAEMAAFAQKITI